MLALPTVLVNLRQHRVQLRVVDLLVGAACRSHSRVVLLTFCALRFDLRLRVATQDGFLLLTGHTLGHLEAWTRHWIEGAFLALDDTPAFVFTLGQIVSEL